MLVAEIAWVAVLEQAVDRVSVAAGEVLWADCAIC